MRFVNVYEITRAYGGPEEGGWWFDVGNPIKSIPVKRANEARRRKRQLEKCMRSTGRAIILGGNPKDLDSTDDFPENDMFGVETGVDYEVRIEKHTGEGWPKQHPHYE